MTGVYVIHGTERSSRAAKIDRLVIEKWGRALLLVPTRQHAARRTERIILAGGLDGAWGRHILTLDDFATMLLRAAGRDPIRLRDTERRLLLDRSLERLSRDGRLSVLGDAAETQGFRSHVLRVITQLKQAAVEPDTFRERVRRRRLRSPLDDVVAEVYTAYQDALLRAGVYDLPGLFWEAEFLSRERRPAIMENVDLLALDGFDDFTPSELRLLTSLAKHVNTLVFGLNYDPSANRIDLYRTTARTLGQIRERFEVIFEPVDEEPPRTFLEFASSNIFWRDEPRLPPGLDPDLEVVPCADFVQEIETIGRRVKSLIIDNAVPPEEIAVVYRSLREAAGTLRSVFAEFDIPIRMIQQPSVWESAAFAFLMGFFDAIETWAREPVVNVLTSPWFNPPFVREHDSWTRHSESFPLLSRTAQIISGIDEWRDRLKRLMEHGDDESLQRLRRSLPEPHEAAKALLKGIETIEQVRALLPEKAVPDAFAAAVDEIIDRLGIPEAIELHPTKAIRGRERAALRALRELLGAWSLWADFDSSPQSRSEFLSSLRQAARETTFAPPGAKSGVACLDAESVRLLRFDYVFLGGVNEGDVPRPPTASAIYSEEDLASLADEGIVIEGRKAHAEREALMFHHVLNVSRKRLCITWRMLSRQGNEQYPSPYVTDVIDLFPGESVQRPFPKADEFVPEPAEAASWRDLRNAVCRAGVPPRALAPDKFARVRVGADIERTRHDRSPFGNYDGVLAARDAVSGLAREFDASHVFSVQQIETYKACPFRFLVERVLGVEAADVPVAEFDAAVRGAILHGVLQAFHEEYRGFAVPDIDEAKASEAMRAHVDSVFGKKAWRSATAPRGVEAIERERILAALERYLRIERERGESEWKPLHFEVGFGKTPGAAQDPLTRPDSYALLTPAGPVLFAGRIDRIDLRDAGARIIDYKSGAIPQPKEMTGGTSLQLAVYALAVEEFLMPGTPCHEAWFVQIGRSKRAEALGRAKKTDEWPDRQVLTRTVVAECVAGIRAGRFPPTPIDTGCRYCAAGRACRYERSRIERKETRS